MSRAAPAHTLEEAIEILRIKRRAFQEILKRYPFYYPNGRRKLFTDADIEALQLCINGTSSEARLFRFFVDHLGHSMAADALRLFGEDKGIVYIIQSHERVKIGFSTNMESRMRVLRTACPYPVTVIAQIGGERTLEQFLHICFKDSRRHGEWFEPTEAVADCVRRFEGDQ